MAANLKLVHSRPHKPKHGASRAQRAHQEAAWALYISEGLAANLRHALAFNSSNMTGAQKQQLRNAIRKAEIICYDLRLYL